MSEGDYFLDRQALGQVFKDPRALIAFEALMRIAQETTPDAIAAIAAAPIVTYATTTALSADRVLTGSMGVTLDISVDDLITIVVDVIAALGYTPANQIDMAAVQAAPVITSAATGAFSAERVLQGSTGVTVDVSVIDLATIIVNVATALGYTPANAAGQAFGGAISAPTVTSAGVLHGASLKTDQTPAVSVATTTHSVPIDFNGTTYYLLVSNAP